MTPRRFAVWTSIEPVTIGTPRPPVVETMTASEARTRIGVWPSLHRIVVPTEAGHVVIEPADPVIA